MKKNVINFLILILITILVLYFSLKNDYNEIINTIKNMNLILFIIAILIYMMYMLIKSIIMKIVVKYFKNDYTLKQSFRMSLETNFFHAITPFATGGQPYEIYRLNKDGISVINAASVSIQNFIIYQTALVLLGIFAVIYNYIFKLFPNVSLLKNLVLLGFIINFLVIVVLFSITYFEKINKVVVNFIINLLAKLKIIKNKEEKVKKFEKYLSDFNEGSKILLKDKRKFLILVLLQLLSLSLLYLVPYFIIKGVGLNVSIVNVIVTSAYVMLIGAFVPIPGGTGGLEYGFISFYGNFITGPSLNAIMLLWRFITYYFGMILGAIILGLRKKA